MRFQLVPCHALHSLLHARFALVWLSKHRTHAMHQVLSQQPRRAIDTALVLSELFIWVFALRQVENMVWPFG
jgi:hypothetical protein